MTEEADILETDNLELVTYDYDNSIINVTNGDIFSGNEKIQVLTLEEARAQGWNINVKDNNVEYIEPYTPPAVNPNPPIIEEENSSDNFPAIGHLEGFEIQTATDGTLLPSTVNAKMADGTYRRLTLFPQLVDGNVTCMVHFENENEVTPIEEQPKVTSISEKIDNIICRNEDIISNSKMMSITKPTKVQPVAKTMRLRRVDSSLKTIIQSISSIPRNTPMHFPIKEAIDPIFHNRFKDSLKKVVTTNKKVPTAQQMNKSTLLRSNSQPNKKIYLPSNKNKMILENSTHQPVSTPKKSDEPDIFIKTNPELTKLKNPHPLGSTENPITLLQNGQVFTSNQSLSETQLQQVSAILKKERNNIGNCADKNFFIDPKTNSKIVYRVVYPDEAPQSEESKPKRTAGKRARSKMTTNEEEVVKETKDEGTVADAEAASDMASPPPKTMKLPRTRSGRLSRPPRHITQDFKRLQINGHVPSKFPEADLYVDYKSHEEEASAPPPPEPISDLNLLGRAKKKKQFKSKYRCPTCQKIYLGHSKMMLHLRKFPDHSNLDEYVEIYERARTERKFRTLNLCKLKRILSGVNKTSYGPLLAKAFTIWDFILLKINSGNHSGVEEVETLIKELYILLEKVKKVAEELLIPIYGLDKEAKDLYVHLDKIEVSNVLGLVPGTYKVNQERLHLLRLANEEEPPPPPPPPPRTTQLATKFEPNLSNKLLDCSNDSIDMDCSSKDVESGDDKKDWHETDFSEFLQNQLPTELWKTNNEVHVSPPPVVPAKNSNDIALWKEEKTTEQAIWKTNDNDTSWKNDKTQNDLWKETDSSVAQLSSWREGENDPVVEDSGNWRKENKKINDLWKKVADESNCSAVASKPPSSDAVSKIIERSEGEETSIWDKKSGDPWDGNEKEGKKDWLRQWKEDAGVPGLRSTRLTSTPETHVAPNALFSPPIRRNSVSSFALNPQEELLGLDLHDLFDELMPDQTKSRPPKPTIDSIINEAFFTETPTPSHNSLPQLIPGALDEVANLDFLGQD